MKRSLNALAAAAVLAATLTASAQAATDIQVRIGDRYEGATLVFRRQPRVVVVPNTRVYYVDNYDYDLYRYGRYWYYVDDGYWYRASSWRGPFVQIRVGFVPRSLIMVPLRYRHHWRHVTYDNASYYRSRDRAYRDRGWGDRGWGDRDDRNHDRGRGKGHGRGNRSD